MKFRKERLSNLIREELSKIIIREINFEGVLMTITEIEISDDFKIGKAKFSTIPSSKEKDALKILTANQNRLQHLLMKKLTMQMLPKITFIIDEGLEKAAKIEKIALDIEKKAERK